MPSNLCDAARLSSRCKAISWELQKDCEFAEKSPRRECCLYYNQADRGCDNYKAQNGDRKNGK